MKNAEISRRLAIMTAEQIAQVEILIHNGYGAQGIKHETGLRIAQINAVFAWVYGR